MATFYETKRDVALNDTDLNEKQVVYEAEKAPRISFTPEEENRLVRKVSSDFCSRCTR